MTEVKHQVAVSLPDTENAIFRDTWTELLPKRKDPDFADALDKYKKGKHYRALLKAAGIFDLEVSELEVVERDYFDETRYVFTVAFALTGEARVLRDMLTSLFGKFLDAVTSAEEDGEPIELDAA